MKRVLIAAVASSLVTGAVIAATGVAGSTDTKKKASPPPTMAQALKDAEKERDDHLGRVAKRLDVSADKLKSAIEKVRRDELDAAVTAGRLTAAQRDAILACQDDPLKCDRSDLPAFGGPGGPHGGPGGPGHRERRGERRGARRDDFLAALAKELDIDAKKVEAAFRAERPKLQRGERHFGPGGPGGPRGLRGGPPPGGPGPGSFEGPGGPPPGGPA
jgi:hypothetical protein